MRVQSWQKGMKEKKKGVVFDFWLIKCWGARTAREIFYQKSTQTIAREKSLQIFSIGRR
jgi:hypothetical protein